MLSEFALLGRRFGIVVGPRRLREGLRRRMLSEFCCQPWNCLSEMRLEVRWGRKAESPPVGPRFFAEVEAE